MTDTKLFATPAEAVACLREALDDVMQFGRTRNIRERHITKARAALESLEAEVGRLTAALDYNTNVLIEQSRKVRALESELAEKTARVAWRAPSTAPLGERVLFCAKRPEAKRGFACIGERQKWGWLDEDSSNNGGMRIEWLPENVLGWLPLDALPALPSEPVKP